MAQLLSLSLGHFRTLCSFVFILYAIHIRPNFNTVHIFINSTGLDFLLFNRLEECHFWAFEHLSYLLDRSISSMILHCLRSQWYPSVLHFYLSLSSPPLTPPRLVSSHYRCFLLPHDTNLKPPSSWYWQQ